MTACFEDYSPKSGSWTPRKQNENRNFRQKETNQYVNHTSSKKNFF